MKITKPTDKFVTNALPAYIVLATFYTLLVIVLPANKATMEAYNLSASEYHVILLAVALPSLIVWGFAFVAYTQLRKYALMIKSSKEGLHFQSLARGCQWLAWSLPVPAIITLLLYALANRWPSFRETAIIASNYIYLLLPLVAFSFISNASRGLMNSSKLIFSSLSSRLIIIFFVAIGVLYCYLTFNQFDLTSLASTSNPYFLPIWLAVLTITIPYFYAWFVGLLAAFEIAMYSRHVHGVIYRQALYLIAGGLIAVVVGSVATQYVNGLQPRVGHLLLDYKLVVSLGFRILTGLGFILLAVGAVRLKRIEEV